MWPLIITALIIDTGASSANNTMLPYIDKYEEATSDHGPAVTSLVLSDGGHDWVCPQVKVDVCNYSTDRTTMSKYYECLEWTKTKHYDVVNLSLSGDSSDNKEQQLLKEISLTSTVVVAAGNEHSNIGKAFPAGYLYKGWENFFVITNLPSPYSNYGKGTINLFSDNVLVQNKNNEWVRMHGTSMSAARYTHKLLKERCANESRN